MKRVWILVLLATADASAQTLVENRDFQDGYDTNLLYVHSTANYAWDLESQFDWERLQFVDNALRVNTGSVSSDKLFTDIELNLNGQLNDRWRISGSFDRLGARENPVTTEQLLLGFEGRIAGSHAAFVNINPEYDKSALDVAVGYGFYSDNREQYARVALLFDDMNYGSKNDFGGTQTQDPLALDWQVRWHVGANWYLYSEGHVGNGYERQFDDESLSPSLAFEEQRNNRAELRLSKSSGNGELWSVWAQWADFDETRRFRDPALDYRYQNTELRLAAEHVRIIGERHRWRFLLNVTDREAQSEGADEHEFERLDVVGGVFYEYLYPNSGVTLAYVAGQPDIQFTAPDPEDSYDRGDYSDKVVIGYRYRFSPKAQLRASLAHEVSASGFGGGGVQFEWFF
ncbi:MAG: hypothetical protein AAFN78_04785 [Pseudomonadota bacterium]